MSTEDFDGRFAGIETWPSLEALQAFHEEQLAAVASVAPALPKIAEAVDAAADRLSGEGRLIYVGAGTSGRIGVQDGVELTPTFNWPEDRIVYLIAGGDGSLVRAAEGAEDDADMGRLKMLQTRAGRHDVAIGIAASGATPFTVAALEQARAQGAMTVGVACNAGSPLLAAAEFPVLLPTGAEVVSGSTRMKAGTAQKVFCNLFSTLLMMRLGRVYRGLMVDMRANNDKLRRRARRMVEQLTGCSGADAADALDRAGGDLKLAVMLVSGFDPDTARETLDRHGGNLGAALAELSDGREQTALRA
ncbi:MAG TPA: N-acetylmuramic acid 6-phosphate etherase [Afifellaceae bacterium]|nr:N-acetylmuramic acid 6-phosphate etherase [Afifellaceae bacterium]